MGTIVILALVLVSAAMGSALGMAVFIVIAMISLARRS